MQWHLRLSHSSFLYLRCIFPKLFKGVDYSLFQYESCHLSKDHRVKFVSKSYSPSKPVYLIHSDVWGPSKVTTLSEKRWFVTFIDDHTRLCWIYLLSKKSEVERFFKEFYYTIETQFNSKICIFRSDNGTEYFNECLEEFLRDKGILHQSTYRDTPQQNGIVERKNGTYLKLPGPSCFL